MSWQSATEKFPLLSAGSEQPGISGDTVLWVWCLIGYLRNSRIIRCFFLAPDFWDSFFETCPEKWNCLLNRNLWSASIYIVMSAMYYAVNFKEDLQEMVQSCSVWGLTWSTLLQVENASRLLVCWPEIEAIRVLMDMVMSGLEWSHEITDIYLISMDHFAVKAMAKSKGCLALRTAQTTDFQVFHKINPWWPCVGNSIGLLRMNPVECLSKRLNFWIKMLDKFHLIYWWILSCYELIWTDGNISLNDFLLDCRTEFYIRK